TALPAFPRRGFGLGQGTAGNGAEVVIKAASNLGWTAAFGEGHDLEHAYRAIERDRDHVALADSLARQLDPPPVDRHVSRPGERRRSRARAHEPRVPQPLINALPVQSPRGLSPLLRVRLQLGLERGELGERRVRVRQLVPTPLVARALDVFCPQ